MRPVLLRRLCDNGVMPELPEVETIARGVDERLRGERIRAVWFSEKREPFQSPPEVMAKALPGKRIERVYRVGKHIVFDLGENALDRPQGASRSRRRGEKTSAQWVVHLGMTGRLLVADAESPVPPHTHGILHLDSGKELRFVDPRRFGRMALYGAPAGRAAEVYRQRPGTADHLLRRLCPAVSGQANFDQGRTAKPKAAAGSGEYLCG